MTVTPKPAKRIAPLAPVEGWPTNLRFRKRSEQIAEQIKAWIVTHNMRPGDKLPQEKEPTRLFGVSKGTAREALKGLEVQGLVQVVTGPGGGAVIAEVSEDRAMDLIGYYFYFRTPTVRQIYDVRKILEAELAVTAVGHLSVRHFARMHALVPAPAAASATAEKRRELRTRQSRISQHSRRSLSERMACLHLPLHEPPPQGPHRLSQVLSVAAEGVRA